MSCLLYREKRNWISMPEKKNLETSLMKGLSRTPIKIDKQIHAG